MIKLINPNYLNQGVNSLNGLCGQTSHFITADTMNAYGSLSCSLYAYKKHLPECIECLAWTSEELYERSNRF